MKRMVSLVAAALAAYSEGAGGDAEGGTLVENADRPAERPRQ